jgi:hypothetical protein
MYATDRAARLLFFLFLSIIARPLLSFDAPL